MLDNDFCIHLEYELSKVLSNSNKEEFNRLWCDGIIVNDPSPYYTYDNFSKKKINDSRKISGTVFIGENGQDKYELTLHFGKYSLRRYAKGTRLEDCVPSNECDDWFLIDISNRKMEIQLK